MTGKEPHLPKWEIRPHMGVHNFAVFLNSEFFASTDDEYRANLIIGAFNLTDNSAASERERVLEVIDNFFGRLENAVTEVEGISVVTWADIDCMYGEFKDELRQQGVRHNG